MKGRIRRQCLEKIARDVANVIKNATAVIIISPDNKSLEFIQNENPRLGVLAIVGPAQGFGKKFNKALLAEIGIGPSRPYHAAKGLNRQSYSKSGLPKRGKWFNLSTEQYKLIASFVFDFIIKTAQQKIARWKSGPYFWLLSQRNYWSQRQKKIFRAEVWREWPKGTRFSFSKKDRLFIADIFWAELNLNKQLIYELSNLARFIDKRLVCYKNAQYYKGVRSFEKLKGARDVEEAAYRFPPYLKKELLNYLPRGKNNYFYHALQDLFGLSGNGFPEHTFAKEAEKLSNPKERLGNIQLKVTTGLQKNRDYIVVEVFPPIESEIESEEESLNDIPF